MVIPIGQRNVIALVNNFVCYARKAHLNNFANHHQSDNNGCISDVLHIPPIFLLSPSTSAVCTTLPLLFRV